MAGNPELVLEFYNRRREQIREAKPNNAHFAIAELEEYFDVTVITQNIDDLHERAGSTNVVHLHGEVLKARSSDGADPKLYDVKDCIKMGDLCSKGAQLRPHVVWFGEPVPEFSHACNLMPNADVVLIVGTSLNVYPAAGILFHASPVSLKFLVDPNEVAYPGIENLSIIKENAGKGVPVVVEKLKESLLYKA